MEFKSSTREINQRLSDLRSQFIFIAFFFFLFTLVILVWAVLSVMKYNREHYKAKTSMKLAERNNELQKKFMAIMSHELRTPLNAISGFCNLINTAKSETEKTSYLNIINESANSMGVLVNDILDYTKITQDELRFNKVNFCLNDLVAQTVKMCEPKRKEGVELKFESQSKVLPVVGDVNRLRQVLINLISNALKFTFKGKVVVAYKTRLKGNEWSFYFEVKDSGVGIPEDQKSKLFSPYAQAHLDLGVHVESTGLGLSICKRLIEKMGGNIGFTSQVGQGSNFFFELHLPPGHAEDCNSYLIPKNQDHKFIGKILVVDDVHLNRLLLEKILAKWGLISVSVASGSEAIEKVKEESFDLVLMDLEMPQMSGIEASEQIKKIHSDLPILVCSANPNLSAKVKAVTDGSVVKPINQADLAETLQRWL
ncbi:MAG: ATP-binding protein [Cyclobacteriaceae bacterium]